ncbi:MAG: hypothetical protein HDR51_00035 [Treponema sp.]|nr:hypothetical protein [Treponema sp.]MDE6246171.1 hypothetical protein [Treponemataceae bacterium]MBD5409430.1 hypothetical protein [Treponema sp.]MBD5409859.1 hypothetical protein [Treponema sp.]MBD5411133.1 hypothetical protein [Treponema sp.]
MVSLENLKSLGIDSDEAIKRFSGKRELYERLLQKFPAAARDLEVVSFLKSGDYQTALANAHSLKGICGNLYLTPLFNAYSDIVIALRSSEYGKAAELAQDALIMQDCVIKVIEA